MFTGIIETLGEVINTSKNGENLRIEISAPFTSELKVDQSVAHNGVCLTVTEINGQNYSVTAVSETLQKSNLGNLTQGGLVNLERCMELNGRLDGHIVQGHVDKTANCLEKKDLNGSWLFTFGFEGDGHLIVEKGSVSVNGVSLTAFDVKDNEFSVAIIPYTFEHTNFKSLEPGDLVNLEFDVIGKYVERMMKISK